MCQHLKYYLLKDHWKMNADLLLLCNRPVNNSAAVTFNVKAMVFALFFDIRTQELA